MSEGEPHPPAGREDADRPYVRVAKFEQERRSLRTYTQARRAIFEATCDLSAYRLQFDQVWHVALLGERPSDELEHRLRLILAAGEPATLPQEIVQLLLQRRVEAKQLGPWVERHHRPGEHL
ncbi:MAG: hypothetical protein IT307_13975 [Chloroflexi bacterium]|nr:hypothetical protein [Chloroflexota bacterium]